MHNSSVIKKIKSNSRYCHDKMNILKNHLFIWFVSFINKAGNSFLSIANLAPTDFVIDHVTKVAIGLTVRKKTT